MYNRQTNSFHHYDSFRSCNTSAARSLARNVEPFLTGKIPQSEVKFRSSLHFGPKWLTLSELILVSTCLSNLLVGLGLTSLSNLLVVHLFHHYCCVLNRGDRLLKVKFTVSDRLTEGSLIEV